MTDEVRAQAIENIKKRNKRDERLAMLMASLAVPVVYLLFYLIQEAKHEGIEIRSKQRARTYQHRERSRGDAFSDVTVEAALWAIKHIEQYKYE